MTHGVRQHAQRRTPLGHEGSAISSRAQAWLRLGRLPAKLGAVVGVLWLIWAMSWRPLSLPDEGRYPGVAWEMLRSGDWLVPTENGLPFFHKPPLYYWITAGAMQLFGANAFAARLAPVLGAGAGAAALWLCSRRWAGARIADRSALVLLTSPFFFCAAQFANMDMLVAGWVAAAVVLGAHAVMRADRGEPWRAFVVAAWAAAALGILSKGLIGIVLPGLVLMIWLLASRRHKAVLLLLHPFGLLCFASIVLPWFLAVQSRHPGFARFFFVYQHFERYAAGGFNNVRPWWWFIVLLPLLALPWSPWIWRSARSDRQGETAEAASWRQLMWIWLGVVLVFFSLPQSKPVGYLLPLVFPLAFLAADGIAARTRTSSAANRRLADATLALGALMGIAIVVGVGMAWHHDNTRLARTLLRERTPGEPVVFVDRYFFDIPLHAQLLAPVTVASDWRDLTLWKRDNWKRELAEGARFAPQIASQVLAGVDQMPDRPCGSGPLWAIAEDNAPLTLARGVRAELIASSNGASLWKVVTLACPPTSERSPRTP